MAPSALAGRGSPFHSLDGVDMQRGPFEEIWCELPDGQAMHALINGDLGFLLYTREPGDPGFSSRNPDFAGQPDDRVEFYLNNGQRDLYPAEFVLSAATVRAAVQYLKQHAKPPTFVTWFNDSLDGTQISDAV